MRKNLTPLLIGITILAVMYIATAFVHLQFDFTKWGKDASFPFIIFTTAISLWVALCYFTGIFDTIKQEDYEKSSI